MPPKRLLAVLVVSATGACSTPPSEPLVDSAVVAAVTARELASERDVAWNARVRRARAAVARAEARAESAGWPRPVAGNASARDAANPDEGSFAFATFDLLGALGLGPAREDLLIAVAEVDRARAALVGIERSAAFAIARADARWSAAEARLTALDVFLEEVYADLERFTALHRVGRLGSGPLGRAQANVKRIEARRDAVAAARDVARAEKARALGVVPGVVSSLPALERVPESAPEMAVPEDVLELHPDLEIFRTEYALAEARLRRIAVERWPRLNVGPRLTLSPDRLIPGGLLTFEWAIPGSLDGEIEAAHVVRRDARARLDDALVDLLAVCAARRAESTQLRDVLFTRAPAQERESLAAWKAARAMVSVREGLQPLDIWSDALNLRFAGIVAVIDAVERVRLADLGFLDASGGRP